MSLLSPLPHSFHEGGIDTLEVGPRRELTLTVTGYFPIPDTSRSLYKVATWQVRFGGIENIEEVRAFCTPALLGSRIGSLWYADDEISRVHRLIFLLTMYDDDATLRIRCRNVTVWARNA